MYYLECSVQEDIGIQLFLTRVTNQFEAIVLVKDAEDYPYEIRMQGYS